MRCGAEIFVVVFGLYCAGFAFVRWHFHSSDTVWLPNAAGTDYNAPIQQERTFIWIPGTGAERPAKQTLYWLFYPAGQIDRLFTGWVYDRTDARNIIL